MSSTDSSDYEEMDTEIVYDDILCVFCEKVLADEHVFVSHCTDAHGVDFRSVFRQMDDVFHIIRTINFLRRERPSPETFIALLDSQAIPWNDDAYLQPCIANDPLLRVDFDHSQDRRDGRHSIMNDASCLKEQLHLAYERIAQMQKTARTILNGNQSESNEGLTRAVGDLKVADDAGYIDSYSQIEIHETMLQDVHRTESYRDAIARNRSLIENKICLDVGCGTGILSMFLARDGKASKVLGVDFSDIIYSAMDVIRENKLESVVHLVKGKLEELELEPVDVIVSEWMGYFLIFESMLDTVIAARDKYLKPGGIILPNKAKLYLTLTDDRDLFDRHVAFWDDVYGFRMSCMRKSAIADALVRTMPPERICATTATIQQFDLNTVTVAQTMSFSSKFELHCERETEITAFVGFFDTTFDLPNAVMLTTDPRGVATHWKQTIFLLPELIGVSKKDRLCGSISVKRSPGDRRGLEVEIKLGDRKPLRYHV